MSDLGNDWNGERTVPVPNTNDGWLTLADMESVYEVDNYDLGPPYGRRFR